MPCARRARSVVGNIEYGQADILKLGSLGRTFDVIESSGVLHHIADPLAGWRTLLSLLRPGGLMAVGLYSEIARADIVEGAGLHRRARLRSTADDIRRCRQESARRTRAVRRFKNIDASDDFFSTSDCRDLLFHVQEHRLTIPQIAGFLADNDLAFIGFEVDPAIASAVPGMKFPRDTGDDRSRILGRLRARASRHVFRHVPVLGAESRLRPLGLARRAIDFGMRFNDSTRARLR